MTAALIQSVLVLLAGAALYLLWRNVARHDRTFGIIIALGLVVRSLLGQVLFWVSWLDLIPRGAHFGHGIWFFGTDGYHYMQAARRGPAAILAMSWTPSAGTYLELLATFALLFGGVASIGVLFNAFCYMAMSWLIARLGRVRPEARTPALLALLAVACYPAGILWSTQPLKDPLLHFLLVALAGSAFLWQRAWRNRGRGLWIGMAFVGLALSTYAISGVRWYLGLAVLGAIGVFLSLIVWTAPQRRLLLFGVSALLFFVLLQMFLKGGGTLIPPQLRRALAPTSMETIGTSAPDLGKTMVAYTQGARGKFERSRGTTEIRLNVPPSHVRRLTAGMAAVLLPHFVIEHLEFMEVGGGRGLFWFADADTIVFIVVALTSMMLVVRRWQRTSFSNPLFWLVALTAVFLALPLLYAVTNFGALFRFRGMLYIPIALLPLAMAVGTSPFSMTGAGDENGAERR